MARCISAVPTCGNLSKASLGRVEAPCCTAPPIPYSSCAILDSCPRVSKSSLTLAIEPSGKTTPPCVVPVCTLIFEIPLTPASNRPRYPAIKALRSSTVLFLLPTSPISPPTEIVIPSGSRLRMNLVISAVTQQFFSCCSSRVSLSKSTRVEASMSMFKNPAFIESRIKFLIAFTSFSGSELYLPRLAWKWSP